MVASIFKNLTIFLTRPSAPVVELWKYGCFIDDRLGGFGRRRRRRKTVVKSAPDGSDNFFFWQKCFCKTALIQSHRPQRPFRPSSARTYLTAMLNYYKEARGMWGEIIFSSFITCKWNDERMQTYMTTLHCLAQHGGQCKHLKGQDQKTYMALYVCRLQSFYDHIS